MSTELARRYPNGWTLAKHLMDWSYRKRGSIETISAATIRRQGYNVEQVKAALQDNDTFENFDGRIYSGSDGSGGIWRVEITQDDARESPVLERSPNEYRHPPGSNWPDYRAAVVDYVRHLGGNKSKVEGERIVARYEEEVRTRYKNHEPANDVAKLLWDRWQDEDLRETRAEAPRFRIDRITKATVVTYRDNGMVTAYIEWIDNRGQKGTTHGGANSTHIKALLDRAKREGITVKHETAGWLPENQEPHRVSDFNSLDDLIAHAHHELGATHVVVAGAHTQIFFPRGGQYPYEAAKVWRKGGYWHAEGPGARTGVKTLPKDAQPIEVEGSGGRRAAEGPTNLDRILDRVEYGKHEVTLDTEGYTQDQVDRVIAAAKARGFSASYDGRFVLIRDLRSPAASSSPKRNPRRSRTRP